MREFSEVLRISVYGCKKWKRGQSAKTQTHAQALLPHPTPFKLHSQPSWAVLGAGDCKSLGSPCDLAPAPLAQLFCMRGRLSPLSALKMYCGLGRGAVFIFLNICLNYFVRASKTRPVFIFYIFLITMIYLLITSVSGWEFQIKKEPLNLGFCFCLKFLKMGVVGKEHVDPVRYIWECGGVDLGGWADSKSFLWSFTGKEVGRIGVNYYNEISFKWGLVHVTSLVILELLFLCSNQNLVSSTVEIFLKSDLETQSDRKWEAEWWLHWLCWQQTRTKQ